MGDSIPLRYRLLFRLWGPRRQVSCALPIMLLCNHCIAFACPMQRKASCMAQSFLTVSVSFTGMMLIIVLVLGLYWHFLSGRRRALASAFVGEIVGILRVIETERIEPQLHEMGGKRRSGRVNARKVVTPFPEPVIFEANANRLDLFKPSVARKITHVYTLLAGVKEGLPLVASDTEQATAILTQLQEALGMANDVLRNLRPLL